MCFFTTSGFGMLGANNLQISIWVSKLEALNLADQNPTLTFPPHVTWSVSLTDTWKISFTRLIPGNPGNLGLWNVPAAWSCLGVPMLAWSLAQCDASYAFAQNSPMKCWSGVGSVYAPRRDRRGAGRLPAPLPPRGRGSCPFSGLRLLTSAGNLLSFPSCPGLPQVLWDTGIIPFITRTMLS